MHRKILTSLTLLTAVFGGLTVVTLFVNIILNYTEIGHAIPDLDLWAGGISAVLALGMLTCTIWWHVTEEAYGKRALIVSELVLLPLLLILIYGMISVANLLVHVHSLPNH